MNSKTTTFEAEPTPAEATLTTKTNGASAQRLRSFIQRIERLEEERKTLATDQREVYSEAKSAGFDPKIMRKIVMLRKLSKDDRAEQEALIQTYMDAVEG